MSDPAAPDPPAADPAAASQQLADLVERSQRLAQAFWQRQGAAQGDGFAIADPHAIGRAFAALGAQLLADPTRLAEAQAQLWRDGLALWQTTLQRMQGEDAPPLIEPERGDRRFKDQAWSEDLVYDFVKQSYLLSARWLRGLVKDVPGLERRDQEKVDFFTRQLVSALAPSNFVLTNPAVLRKAKETGGQNLLDGLRHLLDDLERGRGRLKISMTDEQAFAVGKNVATSPGKVVFQNDLMQLIQYSPSTDQVYQRPLLIVPPWINKFYILDLQPRNSLIKWCVDQGHTTFVVSWVNPRRELAGKDFQDYMLEGPLAALEAIEQATGERAVNVLGFCIGGILVASTLGYLAAKGDDRIKSATFLASLFDFKEVGEVAVFIDDEQIAQMEEHLREQGLPRGPPHGRHVQPDARERPDLVVRGQQLPARARAAAVRPALLECGCDPPAGDHAPVLPEAGLPREPPPPAGRPQPGRRADRPLQGQDAHLPVRDQGRPHRPLAILLPRDAGLRRPQALRAGRVRPHRGRDQPAGREQVRLLEQPAPAQGRPRPGSRAPSSRKAPGGPTGAPGSPARPARRSRPATRATAGSSPSRTPPAPTSRSARASKAKSAESYPSIIPASGSPTAS